MTHSDYLRALTTGQWLLERDELDGYGITDRGELSPVLEADLRDSGRARRLRDPGG